MFQQVHDLLDWKAEQTPDHPFIITEEDTKTYRSCTEESKKMAAFLKRHGIIRGDRILILLRNSIRSLISIMAVSRLGAISVILNTSVSPEQWDFPLHDAAPVLIITDMAGSQAIKNTTLKQIIIELEWDHIMNGSQLKEGNCGNSLEPAFLIYTSGSTGPPKAIITTHSNVIFSTFAIQERLMIQESDRIGLFLPLSFDYGLYQIFLTIVAGASLFLGSEKDIRPDFIHKLTRFQITGLPVVPAFALSLIQLCTRYCIKPSLRFITNTGATLPESYIARLGELMPDCKIYVMYGLTECKRVSILTHSMTPSHPGSVGLPLTGTEVFVVDADGNEQPAGTIGELIVHGPHVTAGYWNAPVLTARRFRKRSTGPEYLLHTGDLCSVDREGFVYYRGRIDDLYQKHGCTINPFEIESSAFSIPGTSQAALVQLSDGNDALFVVSPLLPKELRSRLTAIVEEYKMPTHIISVPKIPLTPNGKYDKKILIQMATNGARGLFHE